MEHAARLARIGDKLIQIIAMVLVFCMMLYGGYSLYDNYQLEQSGFGSDLMKYKPSPGHTYSFAELLAINEDVIGWISVEDTHIDQAVLQGKDDMEYVNKDPLGDFSLSGSIFLSCLNAADFSENYMLLYGHHMENGGMFGDLSQYLDESFFKNHTQGTLMTMSAVWEINLFSVFKTDTADEDAFSVDRLKDGLTPEFSKRLKEDSLFYREIDLQPNDQVLALSTCYDVETNGRIIVFGRLENKQEVTSDAEEPD